MQIYNINCIEKNLFLNISSMTFEVTKKEIYSLDKLHIEERLILQGISLKRWQFTFSLKILMKGSLVKAYEGSKPITRTILYHWHHFRFNFRLSTHEKIQAVFFSLIILLQD